MKKINLILFVAVAMIMAACSNREPVEDMTKYNHTSATVFAGGANYNTNQWGEIPAAISDEEKAAVFAYIASQPEDVAWPGYDGFFLQDLSGMHHMYSYKDFNGAWHNNIDGTQSFENLQILGTDNTWAYVPNANAGKLNNAASNNCALMYGGFKAAKALNEYSSSELAHWKIFYFNDNFYLGLDFDMKKGDGEIPGDGIYDDWVLKIIPGKGETRVYINEEDTTVAPIDTTIVPDPYPFDEDSLPLFGHVEFDVHQQMHTDWNEIKTSIHIRDTVNARIFIPMPEAQQILQDDFALRVETQYSNISLTICDYEYHFNLQIEHQQEGIEISVVSQDMNELKNCLKAARAAYGDGITFEIHSYVRPEITPDQIWSWLKTTECCQTSKSGKPVSGQYVTYTFGQVTSAYYTTNWDKSDPNFFYHSKMDPRDNQE